jgi:hypothetical protein
MTSQITNLITRDSSNLGTTQAGDASYDVVVKRDANKPQRHLPGAVGDEGYPPADLGPHEMFLVALDRTIISTV